MHYLKSMNVNSYIALSITYFLFLRCKDKMFLHLMTHFLHFFHYYVIKIPQNAQIANHSLKNGSI